MGIALIVEVLDHAPQALSLAERLVLIVLAEKANDATRECWPGDELIAHRTGLSEESLTNVFRRLAGHGIEVRVPLAHAPDGRPLYACRGRRKTYRIPPLKPPRLAATDPERPVRGPVIETGPATGHSSNGRSHSTERPVPQHLMPGPATGPIPQQPSENPQVGRHDFQPDPVNADRTCVVCGFPPTNASRHVQHRRSTSASAA